MQKWTLYITSHVFWHIRSTFPHQSCSNISLLLQTLCLLSTIALSPNSNTSTIKMHFFSSLTLVAALLLGANACKCVNDYVDYAATEACCSRLGGEFVNGNDCNADSISEKLSNFRNCCGESQLTSDCDCPTCLQEKTYVSMLDFEVNLYWW